MAKIVKQWSLSDENIGQFRAGTLPAKELMHHMQQGVSSCNEILFEGSILMKRVQLKKLGTKVQKGFTLIELMIVVAIIGILAAIAIPQYQDYVAKTQVARVVSELSAYKTAIEDRMNQGATAITASDVGYVQSDLLSASPFAANLQPNLGAVSYSGSIGSKANTVLTGALVTLSRDASGTWTCRTTQSTSTGWKDTYAPAGCPVAPANNNPAP